MLQIPTEMVIVGIDNDSDVVTLRALSLA